jgi:exodeoxyribonuclease V beta subunit
MPDIHDNFDPSNVILSDSNLIEASAGTGKTFSIALMTVRLIVEKQLPLEKILLVTFTKAAVAELELRVRAFIRKALRYARTGNFDNDPIGEIIRRNTDTPARRVAVENRLAMAQIDLDRLSVMTIHSFCQKVMKEYSFESGQVFGAETLSPEVFDQLSQDAFNEYWRTKITVIDPELLELLLAVKLSHDSMFSMIREGLKGKTPAVAETIPQDFLEPAWQSNTKLQLTSKIDETEQKRASIIRAIVSNKDQYLSATRSNSYAKKAYERFFLAEDWDGLFLALRDSVISAAGYSGKVFGGLVDDMNQFLDSSEDFGFMCKKLINQMTCKGFLTVHEVVEAEKARRGVITFDDMIVKLSDALRKENEVAGRADLPDSLRQKLRAKYDAVFIDEFQDTDKEQYFIFNHLFGENKILFYIGDPKQSIYGFRKADIFTYFKAAASVGHIHRMNVNHRSNEHLIGAMNKFFLPHPDTDTFAYGDDTERINYVNVESPATNRQAVLHFDGKPFVPFRISSFPNKKDLHRGFIIIISDLLRDDRYRIVSEGKNDPVKPSDIGILVRTNKEARAIKMLLSRNRIPAVTIDDTKLFESEEAKELYYVMVAVDDITRSNINRALLSRIGGYDRNELLKADEDAILQRFRSYQEAWKSEGVYVMIRKFLADHGIEDLFTKPDLPNPERTVSNILQLAELVHKVTERRKYDPQEQIQWLKKGIDGETRDGDEFQQRIESDDNAVKIVTIHKSKGLEYKIVIAPHVDLVTKNNFDTTSYRDPNDSGYYVIENDLVSDDQQGWYEEQTEQENRRLLYVAVTRAKYACFIQTNEAGYYNGSGLRYLRQQMSEHGVPDSLIDLDWKIALDANGTLRMPLPANDMQPVERVYASARNFEKNIRQTKWQRTSYSRLSPEHVYTPVPRKETIDTDYDRFVFREIRKGAHTGNLIHYIFERIDFTKEDNWGVIIDRAIRRLSGRQPDKFTEKMTDMIRQVMETCLHVSAGIRMADISWEDRLSELEFDFPLSEFNTSELAAIGHDHGTPFFTRPDESLEGLMNGKIDLIFRYEGKYYILDWKSNHLGDQVNDYSVDRIREAMADNNYHLQYHIYTVALCKYLRTRLPDFDYERDFGGCFYLFVRGMRTGGDTGVFFHKPEASVIDKMQALTAITG